MPTRHISIIKRGYLSLLVGLLGAGCWLFPVHAQVQNPQSGAVGLEATVSSAPPTTPATITFPASGQTFTDIPITVTGTCPKDVLVKLFKNNVFSGSAQCTDDRFSIIADLFAGRNDLVARVYDALDQAGPDSATVSITFNDNRFTNASRVSLTSNYAKRGANPNETLEWPIVISGGDGPYAISIDWGDGKPSDLLSQPFAGSFTAKHVYASAGIYNVLVKASDKNGIVAYLQLVGVANGKLSQTNQAANNNLQVKTQTVVVWWPALVAVPLLIVAFWLGKRYELNVLRKQLERHL